MQDRSAGMLEAGTRHGNVVLSFTLNTGARVLEPLRVLSTVGEKTSRFEV